MNEHIRDAEKGFAAFGLLWFIIIIIVGICSLFKTCRERYIKPPVERRMNVDSVIKLNDSIKIKVNNLDSIKNAKVIEVITLDNDSSLKLFYELVSE